MSTRPIDKFFSAIEAAEASMREAHAAMHEAAVDVAESNLARKIRSIENLLEEVHDEVEELGLQ